MRFEVWGLDSMRALACPVQFAVLEMRSFIITRCLVADCRKVVASMFFEIGKAGKRCDGSNMKIS